MALAKRILAFYLVGTGLAVGFLLLLTGVIHDGAEEYPLWQIMNWFMAVGVAMVLFVSLYRKLTCWKAGSDSLGISIVFYAAVALTIVFFWEWLWTMNPESETGDAVTSHLVYFPLVDSIYTITAFSSAAYLWRHSTDPDAA